MSYKLKKLTKMLLNYTPAAGTKYKAGSLLLVYKGGREKVYDVYKHDPKTQSYYWFEDISTNGITEASLLQFIRMYDKMPANQILNRMSLKPITEHPVRILKEDEIGRCAM